MKKSIFTKIFILTFSIIILKGCKTLSLNDSVDLTITNAHLYVEPGVSPIEGMNISIKDGKIVSIYKHKPLKSNIIINAKGRSVTAGFWNSHVHLTNPQFKKPDGDIVKEMLLKYGFTTVIDTGSNLQDTLLLKKLIEQGKLLGPRIFSASGSFVFTNGTPSYLKGIKLPEIDQPDQANSLIASVLNSGANGIKIFSGSFQSQKETIHLPPKVIRAISKATHSRDSFVMAHPTDRIGVVNAVNNGVDILAHTAPQAGPFGSDLIETMKQNNVAMIPTLKLWKYELIQAGVNENQALKFQKIAINQLNEYLKIGGEILFGTDVGYMHDFNTTEEFKLMSDAGMDYNDILASLTTVPSTRFSTSDGKVLKGSQADLVILKDDPALDITAFSRVAYTIRNGKIIYKSN